MVSRRATDEAVAVASIETAVGVAAEPVAFPITEFAARFAMLDRPTIDAASVVAKEPVPEPVTAPVNVMVGAVVR